jgi:hypothetical protein
VETVTAEEPRTSLLMEYCNKIETPEVQIEPT